MNGMLEGVVVSVEGVVTCVAWVDSEDGRWSMNLCTGASW